MTVSTGWRRLRAWFGRCPVLSAVVLVAACWAGLAGIATVVGRITDWQRERACSALGNRWDPWEGCLVKVSECSVGDRRLPVGAVFSMGSYACDCLQYGGARCRTGILRERNTNSACDASTESCIFEPGCVAPRAYHAEFSLFFEPRPYCSCEGVTFVSAAPTKPYRHVGVCPHESPHEYPPTNP